MNVRVRCPALRPRSTLLGPLLASLLGLFLLGGATALQAAMPVIDWRPQPIRFQGRQIVLDIAGTSGLGAGTVVHFKVRQSGGNFATFTSETDGQGRLTIALDATGLLDRDALRVSIERDGGSWFKSIPTVRESPTSRSNAAPARPVTNAEAAICTTCGSGACDTFSPELFTASNEARDGDVQLVDGSVQTRVPLFSFPSRVLGFELVLHHQSLTSYSGPLEESWSHTYNTFIVETGDEEAWFVTPDLRTFRFVRGGATAGGWIPPEGFFGRVERDERLQRWVFLHAGGTRFEFLLGRRGLPGPLVAISEPNGNRTTASLDPSGLLAKVTTDLGQEVVFTYDNLGRLASVIDPIGRTWRFGYSRGNLKTFRPPATDAAAVGPGGEITDTNLPQLFLRGCIRAPVFEYDDPRWPHQISRMIDPRGAVPVAYAYTEDGRVATRTVNGRPITYDYSPGPNDTPRPLEPLEPTNRITRINDRAGNVVDVEMHGPEGGPVDGEGAFGLRRQVEWTESGKGNPPLRPGATVGGEPLYRERRWLHDCDCLTPIQISQFFGADDALNFDSRKMPVGYPTEIFEYNDRRQVTAQEHRVGTGEVIREERTYAPFEELSRMRTFTDPRGFIHTYEHDPQGNLKLHIGPDVTRGVPVPQEIRESWTYNDRGQMLSHLDPNGNLTTYTYFSGPVGGGNINTRGEFDGFLSSITRGAAGSADPEAGLTTRFKNNALGMVTERTDPRGLVSITEYNDLGEVTRELDPPVTLANGQRVQYEKRFIYDGAGYRVMERRRNINADGTTPANDFVDRSSRFDVAGNRLSQRDEVDEIEAHDLVTRYAYDPNDQLSVVQRPGGNRTFVTYDSWRLPFKFFYGVAPGALPAESYPSDKRADTLQGTSFVGVAITDYDARGNAVRQEDGRGHFTRHAFDFRNRLIEEIDPNGNVRRSAYDTASNVVTAERGSLTEVLERTYFRFDELGRRFATAHDLDLLSDESILPEPAGEDLAVFRTIFDAGGRAALQRDARGNPTVHAYDAAGRPIVSTDAAGNSIGRSYDQSSNLIRVEEVEVAGPGASGGDELYVTTYDYDEANRRTATHDRGLGSSIDHVTRFAYDSRGNLAEVEDAEGNRSVSTWDDQNRLTRSQRFAVDGTELTHQEHGFDANGNKAFDLVLSDVANPGSAQVTRYAHDDLDRLVRTVHPDSDDPIDGSGNGPDGLYDRVEQTYDPNSNILTLREQRGVVLSNTFDAGNRLTRVDVIPPDETLPGERFRRFDYDALDRLVETRNDFARVQREYDALSRLEAETQSVRPEGGSGEEYREPIRVEATWDLQGNRETLSVLDGALLDLEAHQSFDALNRVDAIEARHFAESTLRPVADYAYFGPTRIQRKTLGNGAFLEDTYDAKRRVARHAWQAGGATATQILAGFEHDYDDVDNALFERFLHDEGRYDNFGYNPRYELTGASFGQSDPVDYRTFGGAFDDRFDYDDVFNRRKAVFGATEDRYEANAANEYTEIVRNSRTFAPRHDAAGNAVALPVRPVTGPEAGRDVEAIAAYDAFNQLSEIQAGTNTRQHNHYDALGRRIAILRLRETTPGTLVGRGSRRLVYDGWTEVEERLFRPVLLSEATSTLERVYVQGPSIDELLLTAADGNGDRKVSGVTTHPKNTPGGPDWEYYALNNRLGSVMALLDRDEAGEVLESYRYDAFGQVSVLASIVTGGPALSPSINPFLFQGRRLDEETGLYDNRMRAREAVSGRFVQRDPIGAWAAGASLGNLYGFVGNNPTNYIDPKGDIFSLPFPPFKRPIPTCICVKQPCPCDYDSWEDYLDASLGRGLPARLVGQAGSDRSMAAGCLRPRAGMSRFADQPDPLTSWEGYVCINDGKGGGFKSWCRCEGETCFCQGGFASCVPEGGTTAPSATPGIGLLDSGWFGVDSFGIDPLPMDTLPTRKNYCCKSSDNSDCVLQGDKPCPAGTILTTK